MVRLSHSTRLQHPTPSSDLSPRTPITLLFSALMKLTPTTLLYSALTKFMFITPLFSALARFHTKIDLLSSATPLSSAPVRSTMVNLLFSALTKQILLTSLFSALTKIQFLTPLFSVLAKLRLKCDLLHPATAPANLLSCYACASGRQLANPETRRFRQSLTGQSPAFGKSSNHFITRSFPATHRCNLYLPPYYPDLVRYLSQ